jgi:hypothetical protein
VLIVWDRLFGIFEAAAKRVEYGITDNIRTFNPVKIAFHEYLALRRDLRRRFVARAVGRRRRPQHLQTRWPTPSGPAAT